MSELALLGLVVLGVVVLSPIAARIGVPQPIAVALFGLGVALLPWAPTVDINPEYVLPLVLPPLLFAATLRTSLREFRTQASAVLLLAVVLTLVTAGAVGIVAWWLGLPWQAAAVLGAVVSPPDPVAATSVARRLRLPGRMVTILEGEGLFNDATALVLFRVAVAAAVTGSFSLAGSAWLFVRAGTGGVALGLLAGLLARWALQRVDDAPTETTITLVLPFAAYLGAEQLEFSGVLAVLAAGLYLRRGPSHHAVSPSGWLEGRAVWRYADFLVTSLVFAFVGIELTDILSSYDSGSFPLTLVAAVIGTVVLVRVVWVLPVTALLGRRDRRGGDEGLPRDVREATLLAWAGMRGVVTVATALSLPFTDASGATLPWRAEVVLAALAVVLVTLLAQGLTLSPLVRVLGISSDQDVAAETQRLRLRAFGAARNRLGRLALERPEQRDGVRIVDEEYERWERMVSTSGTRAPHQSEQVDQARQVGLAAERAEVLRARSSGAVPAETADRVLTEIEARSTRLPYLG